MRTTHVKGRVTLKARRAGAVGRLAQFAYRIVTKCWCPYALYHIKTGRIAEFDLRVPHRALHVHPVIVRSTFQWLTRNEWSALVLLSESVLVLGFVNQFFFETFFFPVPVCFLLVRNFGLLVEFLLCIALGTKDTLICLITSAYVRRMNRGSYVGHALLFVVLAHVAIPFADLPYLLNTIACFVDRKSTGCAFQSRAHC